MLDARHVIITHSAADRAAAILGYNRAQARTWLDREKRKGRVVDRLPHPFSGKRSRSGHFVLIDETLIMQLTRTEKGEWLATGCEFFPAWLRARGLGGEKIDPFALASNELTARIGFSEHALDRYAQRTAGFPERRLSDWEKDQAKAELRRQLSRDAHASRERPAWYRSRTPNDFFVVAEGGEICIPMRHTPGSATPFTALTVLHQSMRLFDKTPDDLARACQFTPEALEQAALLSTNGDKPGTWLSTQITGSGQLSWHPPRGHRPYPGARFYVHAGSVFLPAAWDKQSRQPLVILGSHRIRLPLAQRILAWLRGRFALRVS
ncbi:hypothetical protein BJY14_002104 [Actinomadura luteofluorescens]|uniref:Uncharacterized protein n=2 Tax=Actinomadura luteofluorescens TaxID=46163 RepID=A0A7Y9EE72_9ACTN|nr:hypothetical protein [Actinomadura luteofluorescens]NYD46121.1 hypothetical protein [Actinomadura luteofluorescens]